MPYNEPESDKVSQTIYSSGEKPNPAVYQDMRVSLQSYPPLGQVTPVKEGNIRFTVVLDVPQSREREPWEVYLWSSLDESGWGDVKLSLLGAEHAPATLQARMEGMTRFHFATSVAFKESFRFTLKFRHDDRADWRWIRDEQGLSDGFVVSQLSSPSSEQLSDYIPNLNKEWTATSLLSQSPRSRLWSLKATVPAARGDMPGWKDLEIGTPWGSFLRWFGLVRSSTPWLAPRQGRSEFELDKDAILCSFLGPRGSNLVFLGISGLDDILAVFRSSQNGAISVNARNDGASAKSVLVLVAESVDFEHAVAAVMYHARTLASKASSVNEMLSKHDTTADDGDVQPQWREDWYDGLGFCTWNALGQKLTEEKVINAVANLAESQIKISSLIIDDNWQSIDDRGHSQFQHGWLRFEADAKAFPSGLASTVSQIRDKNPWIQHVAVWHALLGYWGGISPDGELAKTYKTIQVEREDPDPHNLPLDGLMTVVSKDDVDRFYNDFYDFLSRSGVDSVKTDAQYMMDTWTNAPARRDHFKAYFDAWALSALRHFGFKAISCMSQHPQAIFYSQMHQGRPAFLVRNSDDFFPDVPDSHPWHVWSNAHNAILVKHLNVIPDWDMFQTVHEYSGFHAAARCISGGPIYITDVPGEHDINLIKQMTGTTPRGKTVIFRPSVLGRSVSPYDGYHDNLLLKVGSYHGASETGTPMLALFNVAARPLTEIIPLSCFPGVLSGFGYVVRSHTTGSVSSPMQGSDQHSLITTSLNVRGYDILVASPLTTFSGQQHKDIAVSNFGLLGKMTGCAAIVSSNVKLMENGRVFLDTRLKALGVLGVYVSTLPIMSINDDFMVTIQGQPIPVETVRISEHDGHVLEVDVERAWNEMKLESGWSNEVEVKVYFSS